MQIREVPITPVPEGSSELEDEAEWIYKQAFLKPPVSKPDSQEARERSRRYCGYYGLLSSASVFFMTISYDQTCTLFLRFQDTTLWYEFYLQNRIYTLKLFLY